ncbi:MAG: S46 family peptidase, partial [Prevotella sp.]
MKKFTFVLAALMAFGTAKADEGMWTLYNLPQAVYQQMQAEGFKLPYADIYQSKDAVKNAVVNFSGYCSGVVVSPNGLVFTNHHCGFEAIRRHSTVEHDYMLNGFYAKTYEEELPNRDMFVSFMKSQQDVTARLMARGYATASKRQKDFLIDSLQTVLTDSVRKVDKTLRVSIDPFYESNSFYATVYQDFTDLRLVFTVPKSMGKFGGETDNWMWPRQTCDFAVFRIYADPTTNGPAAYSKNNVPYRPQHWAPISLDGYKEGDFSMTMGYPGSTSRYISSYGIIERRDCENTPRAQVRGVKQDVMRRHMRASEAVRIKYDSKFAQSANYWKNSLGMNKCIDSIGLVQQKRDYEARLRQWQDSTGFLKGKLDFDKLGAYYEKRFDRVRTRYYWMETFRRTNELATRAMRLAMGGMEVKGPKKPASKQYHEFADNSNEWDAALDKEVLAVLLKNYREHVGNRYLPKFYTTIDQRFGGDYQRFVDDLYARSIIMKKGAKLFYNTKAYKEDPGVRFGQDVMDIYYDLTEGMGAINDSIEAQERYLCA